jgi:hypothetical protein
VDIIAQTAANGQAMICCGATFSFYENKIFISIPLSKPLCYNVAEKPSRSAADKHSQRHV